MTTRSGEAANEFASKVAVSLSQAPPFPVTSLPASTGNEAGHLSLRFVKLRHFNFFYDFALVISATLPFII